ncbi:hypothetical protein CTH30272_01007 [Allocatenococcus thiocycli]|nr:hypothetical protein CTH30272_01007 [Catenococcus thiocycli]
MGHIIIGAVIFSLYLIGNMVAGYYLGKRKLSRAKLAALFSLIFAFFPPVNFVFFAALVFKKDINFALTNNA